MDNSLNNFGSPGANMQPFLQISDLLRDALIAKGLVA